MVEILVEILVGILVRILVRILVGIHAPLALMSSYSNGEVRMQTVIETFPILCSLSSIASL